LVPVGQTKEHNKIAVFEIFRAQALFFRIFRTWAHLLRLQEVGLNLMAFQCNEPSLDSYEKDEHNCDLFCFFKLNPTFNFCFESFPLKNSLLAPF